MWSLCGVRTECVVALASMQFVRLLTLDSDALHTGSNGSSEQSLTSLSLYVFLVRASFVFISLAICSLLFTHSGRAVEFTSRCNDRRFRRKEGNSGCTLVGKSETLPLAGCYFYVCVAIVRGAYSHPLARAREQVGGLATACPSFGSHSFVQ